MGLGKISMHTYEPDKKQLLKVLLGDGTDVDPYTGQLVRKSAPAAASVTVGY